MPDNAKPLILLTRPQNASERFGAMCRTAFGDAADVVIAPLMAIIPMPADLNLMDANGLIFTSAAAVEVYARITTRRDLRAWCVGDHTADRARAIGLTTQTAGGTAQDLLDLILAEHPHGRLVHLHGRHVRVDIAGRLRAAGHRAEGVAIYDQCAIPPDRTFHTTLQTNRRILAPLFSPRSAQIFVRAVTSPPKNTLHTIAFSSAVAAHLPASWQHRTVIAHAPNARAMIEKMQGLITRQG